MGAVARTRCSWCPSRSRRSTGTGLLSDVTRVLSDERVNILSAVVTTNRDRVAVSQFTFEMAEAKHLGHLLRADPQRRGRVRRLPDPLRHLAPPAPPATAAPAAS